MPRFIGHLPLVRLRPDQSRLALDDAALRSLRFDEWHSYDDSFPFADSKYEKTAPTFLEVRVSEDGGTPTARDDLVGSFQSGSDVATQSLQTLYQALLLATAARLPQPELSISLLVFDPDDLAPEVREGVHNLVFRRVGPCNRELIFFGDHLSAVTLDDTNLRYVLEARSLLRATVEATAEAMAALVRTTRPGFGTLSETVHLVNGLEALLVRQGEPLTATFGRRYSVLASDQDSRELEALGRALYRLRSDLVHGRPVETADAEARTDFLTNENRVMSCMIVLRSLRWFSDHPGAGLPDFHAALDEAFEAPETFDALRLVLDGHS